MSRTSKKFVAVLLAVWLPLFSGNVLAASVVMQFKSGDCRTAIQQQAAATEHHSHPSGINPDQPDQHQNHENSTCKNCGVCHLACSGFIGSMILLKADAPASSSPPYFSAQFLSVTLALPDPPPLVRI